MGHVGGQQLLSLGSGCEYVGVIMHELMHSVGESLDYNRAHRKLASTFDLHLLLEQIIKHFHLFFLIPSRAAEN